eukprot:CAMPEP_0184551224 /NCGR_PEP_ID=MMETSP0199_2-20130426/24065_1 /TAXON_ID=1112570 /ORGANISM="Thraustochytrium sp., Strain LLF1b" /LENGTH=746 /DNA_ID=CAMNT_0026946319 /DNA_START=37 /DNA_END=2274 /DNA_ORIENTATION=-
MAWQMWPHPLRSKDGKSAFSCSTPPPAGILAASGPKLSPVLKEDVRNALVIGDVVDVEARTWPGINKPGGVGKITKCHEDGTFNVSYVLGGSEKKVERRYIKSRTPFQVAQREKKERDFFFNYDQKRELQRRAEENGEDFQSRYASKGSSPQRASKQRSASSPRPTDKTTRPERPGSPDSVAGENRRRKVVEKSKSSSPKSVQNLEQSFIKRPTSPGSPSRELKRKRREDSRAPSSPCSPQRLKPVKPADVSQQTPVLKKTKLSTPIAHTAQHSSTLSKANVSTPIAKRARDTFVEKKVDVSTPIANASKQTPIKKVVDISTPISDVSQQNTSLSKNARTATPTTSGSQHTPVRLKKAKVSTSTARESQHTSSLPKKSMSASMDAKVHGPKASFDTVKIGAPRTVKSVAAPKKPSLPSPMTSIATHSKKKDRAVSSKVSTAQAQGKSGTQPSAKKASAGLAVTPIRTVVRRTSSGDRSTQVNGGNKRIRVSSPTTVTKSNSATSNTTPPLSCSVTPGQKSTKKHDKTSPRPQIKVKVKRTYKVVKRTIVTPRGAQEQAKKPVLSTLLSKKSSPGDVQEAANAIVGNKELAPLSKETALLITHSSMNHRPSRGAQGQVYAKLELHRVEREAMERRFAVELSQAHKNLVDGLQLEMARDITSSLSRLESACLAVNRFWRPAQRPALSKEQQLRLLRKVGEHFSKLHHTMLARQEMEARILQSKHKREVQEVSDPQTLAAVDLDELCPI